MICDRCGHTDTDGYNNFHVKHTFGYGTELDSTSVSFSLCDLCLADVVINKIPNAKFKSRNGYGHVVKVSKTPDGFTVTEIEKT